jgi:hypothetical protein
MIVVVFVGLSLEGLILLNIQVKRGEIIAALTCAVQVEKSRIFFKKSILMAIHVNF